MEMTIAIISLVTALIGLVATLVATLVGKKQIIIIRESSENEDVPRESSVMTKEEIVTEEHTLSPETSTRQPAMESIQLTLEQCNRNIRVLFHCSSSILSTQSAGRIDLYQLFRLKELHYIILSET